VWLSLVYGRSVEKHCFLGRDSYLIVEKRKRVTGEMRSNNPQPTPRPHKHHGVVTTKRTTIVSI